MKLAIIYDWLDSFGGAEKILQTVFDHFSTADIYTLYADYKKAPWAKKYQNRIKATFLQNFYNLIPNKKLLAPFMPFAIESLNLSNYDRVLSISSSFGKGVITRPETKHACYLFTSTRWLWQEEESYKVSRIKYQVWGRIQEKIKDWLRKWDMVAIHRPDKIITLSEYSRAQIKSVYDIDAEVLSPPFNKKDWLQIQITNDKSTNQIKSSKIKTGHNLPTFQPFNLPTSQYFLFVGRLEPYKRVDLLIEAFKKMPNQRLVIVGSGSLQKKVEEAVKSFCNLSYLSNLSDLSLKELYQKAQALIMPQAEDFGYTALEALCLGTPIISYKHSGAAEILESPNNGVLFPEQSVEGLRTAVENFKRQDYNNITVNWEKYSQREFLRKIEGIIN